MRTDPRLSTRRRPPGGFTLIEIMIAAGIIVLMLAMALPVFRLINGSRSQEGAANLVAALLARARADAVGLHQPAGVAFLYNAATATTYMAEVQFPDCQYFASSANYKAGSAAKIQAVVKGATVDTYYLCTSDLNLPSGGTANSPNTDAGHWQYVGGPPLDLAPDTDLITLPRGVGVQTICNVESGFSGGVRASDGYLSVGVILFDSHGRVTAQRYGMAQGGRLLAAAKLPVSYPSAVVFAHNAAGYPIQLGVESQFGLVVYPLDAFTAQNFPTVDPTYTNDTSTTTPPTAPADYTAGGPSQSAAEQWLDVNATPLLIDRYTGELVRTQ